jgi:hypothetical protein
MPSLASRASITVTYLAEKADALDRLGKLIDRIVNPPDRTNVVAGVFPRSAGGR